MKLTKKQKAFADHIINNPKQSATEAAAQTYNVVKRHTAEQIAHENLMKPEIVSYLSHHNNLVENTIINTINDYKESEQLNERALAVNSSMWVHDKLHGKATQRTENVTSVISINLDLTQQGQHQ